MLNGCSKKENHNKVVQAKYEDIKVGNKLSESFEKYPNVFDNIYINMLIAAEEGGNYGVFLNELVVSMKKEEKMRKDVKKALIYPMIVTTVAIVVIVLMMIYVVPVFPKVVPLLSVNDTRPYNSLHPVFLPDLTHGTHIL